MQPRKLLVISLIILALAVSACSPAADTAPVTEQTAAEEMMEKPTEETMMEKPTEDAMSQEKMAEKTPDAMMEKPTEPAAMAEDEKMMDLPAWFSASLTDARSGQTFTINDFKGKVILVETLAQWCSNCLKQQKQVL